MLEPREEEKGISKRRLEAVEQPRGHEHVGFLDDGKFLDVATSASYLIVK